MYAHLNVVRIEPLLETIHYIVLNRLLKKKTYYLILSNQVIKAFIVHYIIPYIIVISPKI